MTIAAWILSIPIQAALLAVVLRRRRYPFFAGWLAWDLGRSVLMLAIYLYAPRSDLYAVAFATTEPFDMVLLGMAGLEAAGCAMFGWGLAIALAAGCLIDFPLSDLPFRTQFLSRALVAGAVASALVLRWWRMDAHQRMMFAFCAVDLTAYLSIVFFWPNIDRDRIQSFITVSQCLILLAWLIVHQRRTEGK